MSRFRRWLLLPEVPDGSSAKSNSSIYPSYAVFKERVTGPALEGGPGKRSDSGSGADRVRTDDFQLAKLALSQLSYSPNRDPGPTLGDGPRWTRTTDLALIRRAL